MLTRLLFRSVVHFSLVLLCLVSPARLVERAPSVVSINETRHPVSLPSVRPPLTFEINRGQAAPQVQFLARGSSYHLFLTPTEAIFQGRPRAGKHPSAATLQMRLVGANSASRMQGIAPQRGKIHHLHGKRPENWRTNIATYAKVHCREVYPGVDLVYYGNASQKLEYDFLVSPGADPKAIQLEFEGAERLKVDSSGNLQITLSDGEIRWQKPVCYQEIGGKRHPIAGKYVLSMAKPRKKSSIRAPLRVAFDVARYDRRKPLVIDPAMLYSTYLGGNFGDSAQKIAVDTAGNFYVTGNTRSFNFPTGTNSYQWYLTTELADVFVSKFSPAGDLLYSTYLGGNANDFGQGIAIDAAGNAYVTGATASDNFPTTSNAFQRAPGGFVDVFVAKLSADGSNLLYSTFLGGGGPDQALDIALDTAGRVYVAGEAYIGFPTTAGAYKSTTVTTNAVVAKLDTTLSGAASLVYSTYLGGTSNGQASSIAVDMAGNAYVAGSTNGTDFPTTAGVYQPTTSTASNNIFITKLNASGSGLLYSTYLGTGALAGMAIDLTGNVYTAGTNATGNVPGSYNGGGGIYLTKLNVLGSGLLYTARLPGFSMLAHGMTVDSVGNTYITGITGEGLFPTPGGDLGGDGSNYDACVAKLSADGAALVYWSYLGGEGLDDGLDIAVDPAGRAYVCGYTNSLEFPVTANAFQDALDANIPSDFLYVDAFVTKVLLGETPTDINRDGNPDLVWQNQVTGAATYWQMNGTAKTAVSGVFPNVNNPIWKIVDTPYLNNDSKPDVLFQNQLTGAVTYWLLDGLTRIGYGYISRAVDTNWKIVGAADINGDSKQDILFQNQRDGAVAAWKMNGVGVVGFGRIYEPGNANMKVAGIADMNRDGRPDLIMQNQTNNQVTIQFLGGGYLQDARPIGSAIVSPTPSAQWKVVGVADMSSDGKPDLFWQNGVTGAVTCWLMDGATLLSMRTVQASGDVNWRLIAPH